MMYILLGHQDSIGSISETLSTFNNIISQASKFLSLQKKKKINVIQYDILCGKYKTKVI